MKICVVGCERSGTSAVALLISKGCGLSLLDDPPEAWYATAQLRLTGRGIGRELAEEIRRHEVVKVPGFAAVLPELGRCFPLPFRVIYCVRDPRDAIASIRERLAQGESFMGHTRWLGVDSKDPIEALAWKWRIYLETALGYRNQGGDVAFVRYEDFCRGKVETVEQLARWSGLPFRRDAAEPWANRQLRKHWSPRIAGPGRWRDDLSAADADRVAGICAPLMQCFGYDQARPEQPARPPESVPYRVELAVSSGGELLARRDDAPVVCVACPGREGSLESFIRAHLARLPARVRLLSGGPFPRVTDTGQRLTSTPRGVRYGRAILSRLFRVDPGDARRRNLVIFLRRNGVRVVLAEYGPTGVAVMDACRDAHVPLVVHFHGFDAYDEAAAAPWNRRYPDLFANAAAIVAVSGAMMERLRSLGAPEDKLRLNPCGVDVRDFDGGDPCKAPPLFVSVGRFVDKKAPYLTILAFHAAWKEVPEIRLRMVGAGPLLESSIRLARQLGLGEDTVQFDGAVAHGEIAALMRLARAFVQHSVQTSSGDNEGTPVAMLEAAATGLPVVSTRHAGIPEVVLDGKTGILVDEGDIDAMAAAIIRLARDPHAAAELGTSGRERVRQIYSMDRSIAGLWNILEEAMDLQSQPSR